MCPQAPVHPPWTTPPQPSVPVVPPHDVLASSMTPHPDGQQTSLDTTMLTCMSKYTYNLLAQMQGQGQRRGEAVIYLHKVTMVTILQACVQGGGGEGAQPSLEIERQKKIKNRSSE